MSRTLSVEPEAEAEIADAAEWYDQRSLQARVGFLRAVERALSFIRDNPAQYQTVHRHVRRAVLNGYPYALMYTASATEVNVIACHHDRRDPKRWQDRIGL
jgi:plasmid stabilization system protein ParE